MIQRAAVARQFWVPLDIVVQKIQIQGGLPPEWHSKRVPQASEPLSRAESRQAPGGHARAVGGGAQR